METLAIGEVARRAGINASAIRYYERAGLVHEPGRVGGKRRYGPEVLRTLALIEAAKRVGLTSKRFARSSTAFPTRWTLRSAGARSPPARWRRWTSLWRGWDR